MKFCTKCGAPIVDDEAIFCGECGNKLTKEEHEDMSDEPTPEENDFMKIFDDDDEDEDESTVDVTENESASTESNPQSVQEIMQEAKTQSETVNSNSILEAMNRAKAMRATNQQNQPIQQPQSTQSMPYGTASTQNIYVPDQNNFHDLFLKRDGRLNRLRYFKRSLIVGLIGIILYMIALPLMAAIVETGSSNSMEAYNAFIGLSMISMILISALSLYLSYGLIVRRSHDLHNQSMFFKYIEKDDQILAKCFVALQILYIFGQFFALNAPTLTGLCDLVWCLSGGFLGLYLLFAKGEVGANKFGHDPLGNTNPYNYNR